MTVVHCFIDLFVLLLLSLAVLYILDTDPFSVIYVINSFL